MKSKITDIFNMSASDWMRELQEMGSAMSDFAQELLTYSLFRTLTISFLIAIGGVFSVYLSQKAIQRGKLGSSDIVCGKTFYFPTGKRNSETGKEYYEQKLITAHSDVKLSDIFSKAASPTIGRYLRKAQKKCTADRPVIFDHLDEVLPKNPQKSAKIKEQITRDWRNYFSASLNGNQGLATASFKDRTRPDLSNEIFPVLIYEPGAQTKIPRIIFVHKDEADAQFIPDKENIVLDGPGGVTSRPDSHLLMRATTMRGVYNWLNGKDADVNRANWGIRLWNGETIQVEDPQGFDCSA